MWRRWLAILVVAGATIAAILVLELSELPRQPPLVHHNEQQQQRRADKHDERPAITIGEGLNLLASIAIALFTGTLWWATRGLRHYAGVQAADMQKLLTVATASVDAAASQAEAMRQLHRAAVAQEAAIREQATATQGLLERAPQIERAYISANMSKHTYTIESGGGVDRNHVIPPTSTEVYSGHCLLGVSNHGRTPGILLRYAITFVDIDSIPETPTYDWIDWFEWIGPGIQERNIRRVQGTRDSEKSGCIWKGAI
jgi:type II secretory pathway pseudopilin PulG